MCEKIAEDTHLVSHFRKKTGHEAFSHGLKSTL